MKLQHKNPCSECPWRRVAAAGWLGGHTPEKYADAVTGNEVPACHLKDHGPEDDRTAMCAGALAVMANACISAWKTEGGDEARLAVRPRKDCFRHPRDFYEHHAGKLYVPFVVSVEYGPVHERTAGRGARISPEHARRGPARVAGEPGPHRRD